MEIKIENLQDIDRAAREFLDYLDKRDGIRVVAFNAPMGAGKTTFIAALCRARGVIDDINSPTFSIVNEYVDAAGETIFHFDCYRIKNLGEAMDIGAEDYLDSGNLCLIEWPDVIDGILPDDTLRVEIRENGDGSRTVKTEE